MPVEAQIHAGYGSEKVLRGDEERREMHIRPYLVGWVLGIVERSSKG